MYKNMKQFTPFFLWKGASVFENTLEAQLIPKYNFVFVYTHVAQNLHDFL